MTTDALLLGARGLWEELARVPASFPPSGQVNVVVSPASGVCPAGWVGVVALGGSALVTAPAESTAGIVRAAPRWHTPSLPDCCRSGGPGGPHRAGWRPPWASRNWATS